MSQDLRRLAVTLMVWVHIIIPQQVFEGGVDCGTRERAQVVAAEGVVILRKCFGVVWGGGGESTVRRGFDET